MSPAVTGSGLAAHLTEYVVLANDPAVPMAAADFWAYSSPSYRAVVQVVEQLVADDPTATRAYRALCAEPTTCRFEQSLTDALAAILDRRRDGIASVVEVLRSADSKVYVRYQRGGAYTASVSPVGLAEVAAWVPRSTRPAGCEDAEVLIAIPLRDRVGGSRVRNLLACLASLRDQSMTPAGVLVAVVETDSEPRWQHLLEPLVDRYIFAAHDGPFNRSWTANVAVANTARQAPYVCVLDADILTDRLFLERNVARLRTGAHDAHLPFALMSCLDEASSHYAIRQRCAPGAHCAAEVGDEHLRSLLLREVPGACLWVRREFYERVGGFDERYEGWGGEDDDLDARMRAAGTVRRFDDRLLHLAHPRPSMVRADGRPYNAHIPPMSWTPAHGFGRVEGPLRSLDLGAAR